ncbi:MAG: conjugative transfer protein [Ruminococcus sp.]|nr:conjugative transfer protein [Ruminococcus sp.]
MFAMAAFAEGEGGGGVSVSTSSFISTACKVLKALIILVGGGIGVWGLVNLVEGYGSDNPGSKSQGMKQLMAGIALIILAIALVPELEGMMSSAVQ